MMLSIWYIFLIIPIGIFYIFLSYLFSIDWQNSYQKENSRFPNFSETQSSPLVIANIKINDLVFRLRILNPKASGDTIILLHGFPQTSISWEPVFDSFKNSDYRVIAYDQRGYSPLARPKSTSEYTTKFLIDDLLGVADALGAEKFHLIGHDWERQSVGPLLCQHLNGFYLGRHCRYRIRWHFLTQSGQIKRNAKKAGIYSFFKSHGYQSFCSYRTKAFF